MDGTLAKYFLAAAASLLAAGVGLSSAEASTVTYYSRPIVATANGSAQDYLDNWNAALNANPVEPTGFGEAIVRDFYQTSNQSLITGGATSNISEFYNMDFNIPASVGTLQWKFRFTPDFGLGGAVFLDGVPMAFNSTDLNGQTSLEFVRKLKPGQHNIQVYGQESCCDGYSSGQFRAPGGPRLTTRDISNFEFTDGWNLK